MIKSAIMNEQQPKTSTSRRKPGRPKKAEPLRVMVSVPGELADAVKEIVRAYRAKERQP